MWHDADTTVEACKSCARNNTGCKRKRPIQMYRPSGPLDFVAMNILVLITRTKHGNPHVIVITDQYSKLTRAIATAKMTVTHVSNVFFDYWVAPYSIPTYVLTYSSAQSVSKFFTTICTYFGNKHLTTTVYHQQTNGLVERYDRTNARRLRHYIAENLRS